MSPQRIVDALRDVEASILLDTMHEEKYKMLSKLNDDAKYIYDAFNLKTSGLSVVQI